MVKDFITQQLKRFMDKSDSGSNAVSRPHIIHRHDTKINQVNIQHEKNIYTPEMLTAGEVLRRKRNELGLTIKRVALDTKIQERYISYIEENDFSQLSTPVYINGFIKIYADYLGLDVDKVSALYRRSIGEHDPKSIIKTDFIPQNRGILENLITPTNLIIAIGLIFLLSIGTYISIQFYSFSRAPELVIDSPKNGAIVETSEIEIKGKTEQDVFIQINDQQINVESDGKFASKVTLREGQNSITVKAIKKSNQKSTAVKALTIQYNNPDNTVTEEPQTEPEAPAGFVAKLEVRGAEAWIVFNVDNKPQASKILPAGYSESFDFTEEIYISTGRPGNTFLFINDEPQQLNIDSVTGTAKLTCTIKSGKVNCK